MGNPDYPVYIPSKGRAGFCMTMRAFDELGVPFRVVVEAQERDVYTRQLGAERVLVLDPQYQRDYDTCDSFGLTKSPGSGPARNFIWDHATSEGHAWHWVVDDNITAFYQRTPAGRLQVLDGTIFQLMEGFAGRYTNVGMCGPNYRFFVPDETKKPPFHLNTKVYSCNLIRNDVPMRWRCRYNEDVDLSLRMIKAGWCTILFNGFLQAKVATQQMKGGNTDAFYAKEGTTLKALMLHTLHPNEVAVTTKYGRTHHHVDWTQFTTPRLVRRDDLPPPTGRNTDTLRVVRLPAPVTRRRPREFWTERGIIP